MPYSYYIKALGEWINMAAFLTLCVTLLFFSQTQTYDQFVHTNTKVAVSSTHENRRAEYAVDGNFNQSISYCFHSGVNGTTTEAWLRIDLGRVFSVNSVKFWYRTDDGTSYYSRQRLPGFSIRVSNDTTRPTSNSSCYTSSLNDDMPTVVERDCERTTRYVWIYQSHTASGDICPILEICEVQVFGCKTGYYGYSCVNQCNHCVNTATCGIKEGMCDGSGCVSNVNQPLQCPACQKGKYGRNCEYTCGNCYKNNTCDREDGTCSNGCETGYGGRDCKTQLIKIGDPNEVWHSHSHLAVKRKDERLENASLQLSSIIKDGIKDKKVIQETVRANLHMMDNLTSSTHEINAIDLEASLDILEKIVNITGPDIEKNVFYTVIDNVLSTKNSKSWTTLKEKEGKGASSILKNMDQLSEILMQDATLTTTKFVGSNLELTINEAKVDETDIRFPEVTLGSSSDNATEISTFLELPKQNIYASKGMQYAAVIYKTLPGLLSLDSSRKRKIEKHTEKSKSETFVNSAVLSLTTKYDIGQLDPPLTLTFEHIFNNESNSQHPVCVSWEFTTSKWTEKGCTVNQSDRQKTVCLCNHLTNFAILMRPYTTEKEDSNILKIMSFIGVVISIAFTFITFVIYIMTWRYIKSEHNIMMMNMCGSLMLSLLMFITTVERTSNEDFCIAITAVIHYLFLVTFFSMLGIGVYFFMSVTVTYCAMHVANNFKSKPRIHWFLLCVWGFPSIVTATNLGVFFGKGYHLKNYCWLSMESGSLYLFVIPVCLINMLNIFIIVSLLRVLYASKTMSKSSLQKKASSGLRSLGTLVPVLGVTWIIGIFAVDHKTELFQYIFVIANSLQGFFIFVSHVLLNKKVRQGLNKMFPNLRTVNVPKTSEQDNLKTFATQSQSLATSIALMVKNKEAVLNNTNCHVEKSGLTLTEKTEKSQRSNSVFHGKVMRTPDNETIQPKESEKEACHNTSFLYTYNMPRGLK